jgi:hypothetical protein
MAALFSLRDALLPPRGSTLLLWNSIVVLDNAAMLPVILP